MTRGIIIMEDKMVGVTGNDVWMTAGEIAGLFHTGVPAVNAAIRYVLKTDMLSDYEHTATFSLKTACKRMITRFKSSYPPTSG